MNAVIVSALSLFENIYFQVFQIDIPDHLWYHHAMLITPDLAHLAPLLSTQELAALCHCHVLTVRRWIHAGHLQAGKVGRRGWSIPRSEVHRLLQRPHGKEHGSATVLQRAVENICAG